MPGLVDLDRNVQVPAMQTDAVGRTRTGILRRDVLRSGRDLLLTAGAMTLAASEHSTAQPVSSEASGGLKASDRAFLEDLERRCVRYFWEQADPHTGVVLDRARLDGAPAGNNVGSTAATGFGLSAICAGANRGWIPREQVRQRVLATLRWHWRHAFHEHGWLYHFMDIRSGEQRLSSEISTIDTALFLCGVLTAAGYFSTDREIQSLAHQIAGRVDYRWMLAGNPLLLSHGARAGSGFIKHYWSAYSEASVLYLLAIGSPKHAIPADSWYAWSRPKVEFDRWTFVSGGPLFTHQFSHAWVDFRHQQDGDPSYLDYHNNSVIATYAHRDFCLSLQGQALGYGPNMWGVTVSDSPTGYVVWGGPPFVGPINGTLVPCAAAGSLMFAPQICLPVLREMQETYGSKIYGRYGFADAFNPNWQNQKLWVNQDVVGIDVGITALSIENTLTGNIWRWFMRNPYVQSGMERAGFRLATPGIRLKETRTTTRHT